MNNKNKFWFKKISVFAPLLLGLILVSAGIWAGDQDTSDTFDVNTLKEILQDLRSYHQGQNDDFVLKLNEYLRNFRFDPESRKTCEKELLVFLESDATNSAKSEVCRQLRVFGSSASIPVLAKMLLQEETTDLARYALEKIPGEECDKTLINALQKSRGDIRLGIISTLGQRGNVAAVPILKKWLSDSDKTLAESSAAALGEIAGEKAIVALDENLGKAQGTVQIQIAGSLLKCAERLVSQDKSGAIRIYDRLIESKVSNAVTGAALQAKIKTARASGKGIILDILQGTDQTLFEFAVINIPVCCTLADMQPFCSLLPELPNQTQVQLIGILSFYKDPLVLDSVTQSLQSQDIEVRFAALKALKKLGDETSVEQLAQYAVGSKGEEQAAARSSLWELTDTNADRMILLELEKNLSPELLAEYIRAAGERRIYKAKSRLFELARSADEQNRLNAMRSLKSIAQGEDMTQLLKLLLTLEDERGRNEMINTIAAVSGGMSQVSRRGRFVTALLPQVSDVTKKALLYRVLGKIGDDQTLPLLRRAMIGSPPEIEDAVIRAWADWPTPGPRDDLIEVAKKTDNNIHQVLALQAYIRMIGLERYRKPAGAIKDLEAAVQASKRTEENKMVLGLLPQFVCPEALQLARSLASEEGVEKEAAVAINKLEEALKNLRR